MAWCCMATELPATRLSAFFHSSHTQGEALLCRFDWGGGKDEGWDCMMCHSGLLILQLAVYQPALPKPKWASASKAVASE